MRLQKLRKNLVEHIQPICFLLILKFQNNGLLMMRTVKFILYGKPNVKLLFMLQKQEDIFKHFLKIQGKYIILKLGQKIQEMI